MTYTISMITISEAENFSQWFAGLRDTIAKARVKLPPAKPVVI